MNKTYRIIWNNAKQANVVVAETTSARGKPCSGTKLAARIAAIAGGLIVFSVNAQTAPPPNTLPTGGQVTAGQANISQTGAHMLINQGSDRVAIDWQTFNVGQNAHVQFQQPDASSVALNRVLSADPSQIFGRITANGQVILTNPSGVYFGPSARVDVGGLIATTHSISNDDFMAGNSHFERDGSTGSVDNDGEIKAAIDGYVALLAPEVRNQGAIIAQMGTVALAAGEAIDLHFDSNNRLTSIRVEPSELDTLVENRYAVQAPGGLIILAAQSMDRLIGGVVKNSGAIEANGLQRQGGRIILAASNKIENTSVVRADATDGVTTAESGPAGIVEINAPEVTNSGTISASGSLTASVSENLKGGSIKLTATQLENSGTIVATSAAPFSAFQDVGRIDVVADTIKQTASGSMDVSGEQQGGLLSLQATGAVELSGTLDASANQDGDTQGGVINVAAQGPLTLLDANLDASGGQGGQVLLQAIAPVSVIESDHVATSTPLPEKPAQNQGQVAILGSSSINVRGRSHNGGRALILGDHLFLNDTTRIDVTGATGGGDVLVGGDWQGSNGVYQSTSVVMSEEVVIDASAIVNGDGGKVVLWSDIHNLNSIMVANGTVFARGGEQGGDGGKVETSAHSVDIDRFKVNTQAPLGKTGLWLIDPYDYLIGATQASAIVTALDSSNVSVTTAIQNVSYGAGIDPFAPGNITVNSAISSGSVNTLELKAASGIVINADITRSGVGGLTLRAGNNSISGSGKLVLGGGTTLKLNQGNTLSNNIELTAGGAKLEFASLDLEFMIAGGGGGGGADGGGGGGGGGTISGSVDLLTSSINGFAITVGAGGSGGLYNDGDNRTNGAAGAETQVVASDNGFTFIAGGGAGGGSVPGDAGGAGGVSQCTGFTPTSCLSGGLGGLGADQPSEAGTNGIGGLKSGFSFDTGNPIQDLLFFSAGGGGGGYAADGGKSSGFDSSIYDRANGNGAFGFAVNGGAGIRGGGGGGGKALSGAGTRGNGGDGGNGVVYFRYFGITPVLTGGSPVPGTGTTGGYSVLKFEAPGSYTVTVDKPSMAVTLNGNISGAGGLTLNANGGSMTLGGTSTYSGPTSITGGTIKTTSTSALGNSAVTLANTAGVVLDISASNLAIGSLAGSGVTGGNVALGGKTLSVGANDTGTTYNGIISGTGGLTKQGTGTFTLTANQSYTDATAISAGTLVLQNNAPTKATSGFNGAGALRIESTAASFTSVFSTSGWTFGSDLGGLSLGKASNQADITVPDALNIAGPVSIYGGDLSLSGGISTSDDLTTVATGKTSFGAVSVGGNLSSTTKGAGAIGGVSQTGALIVTGTSTFIADTGTNQVAALDNTSNDFVGAVSFTNANSGSWKDVRLNDANGIILGDITANKDADGNGGTLTVDGGTGDITQDSTGGKNILVDGDTNLLTDGDITLDEATNDFQGLVNAEGDDITLRDGVGGLVLGDINAEGNLDAQSTDGDLTQADGTTIQVKGDTDLAASEVVDGETLARDITLDGANNDFNGTVNGDGGSIELTDVDGITLGEITTRKDADGNGGTLTVDGGTGDITQDSTGGKNILVDGDTNLLADGDITLDEAANDFQGLVNISANDVSLTDSNSLQLGNVETTGDVSLNTNGLLDLGTSRINGNLNADTGNGDIVQKGPLFVGGDTDLNAGSGRITLTNTSNDLRGRLTFKASFLDIFGAASDNAELQLERVLGTVPGTSNAGLIRTSAAVSTQPAQLTLQGSGLSTQVDGDSRVGILVRVEPLPATDGATIISVSVPEELSRLGSSFRFQLPETIRSLALDGDVPVVSLVNGATIPSWLVFDASTMTFAATDVPAGGLPISVAVVIGDHRIIVVVSESLAA